MSERLQKNARRPRKVSPTIQSTELIVDNDYAGKAIDLVKSAQRDIVVCAYAWRWYEGEPELGIQQLNSQLLAAKLQGLRVRCLVDGYRVFEMLKSQGFECKYVNPARMLHTKAIMIDGTYLIIGSHNMTKRANRENLEMSLITTVTEPILQFTTYFEKLWAVSNET